MNVEQEIRDLKEKVAELKKRLDDLEFSKKNVVASNATAPSGLPIIHSM